MITVSYTHLDVYKRQVYTIRYCELFLRTEKSENREHAVKRESERDRERMCACKGLNET